MISFEMSSSPSSFDDQVRKSNQFDDAISRIKGVDSSNHDAPWDVGALDNISEPFQVAPIEPLPFRQNEKAMILNSSKSAPIMHTEKLTLDFPSRSRGYVSPRLFHSDTSVGFYNQSQERKSSIGISSRSSNQTKQTPYESLKTLIEKKNSAAAAKKTSSSSGGSGMNKKSSTTHCKPSSFIRQALSTGTLDRSKNFKPISTSNTKNIKKRPSWNFRLKKETYAHKLHSAIKDKASHIALEKIIDTQPSVVTIRDGREKESALHVLLKHKPKDVFTADKMLLTTPHICRVIDRHGNTPLHIAFSHGASIDLVRHLIAIDPTVLNMRNFHGQTPAELVQRNSSTCSESVSAVVSEKIEESEGADQDLNIL